MKIIATLIILAGFVLVVNAQTPLTGTGMDSAKGINPPIKMNSETSVEKSQQLILWTSGDREVALKMVFMYALNCKKYSWMNNVRLLIWGPSGKLLTEEMELQKYLNELKNAGIELYACKGCADLYGISDKLTKLGVTVMYTGQMLADLQKEGWFILSI